MTVNFNVTLTGRRDANAEVRWSLYNATRKVRVPRAWLTNRSVLLLTPGADVDAASGEFWAPLPRATGPYFIRIALYDASGTRLDYVDTPDFR